MHHVHQNQVFSRGRRRNAPSATMALAAMLLAAANANAATIYVNASGTSQTPDGTSWKTAFVRLQDALDAAAATSESDQIWVAKGTYAPTKVYAPSGVTGGASGIDSPALKTFDLPDGVAIYGGFSGREKALTQRNPAVHPTILSGGGTSWHVVTAGDDVAQTGVAATLDGLTIRDGNAQGPAGGDLLFSPFVYAHNLGGGLYVAFDSVIGVSNVRFLQNAAGGDGGGMFAINSTVNVTGSYFAQNAAIVRAGAIEVLNTYETAPHTASIASSTFEQNTVVVFGGAIVGEGTLPNDGSSLDINDCVFKNNTAQEGGAIVFDSQKTTVRNSRFEGNFASINAGALATTNVVDTFVNAAIFGPAHPFTKFGTAVSNCTFTNNVAEGDQALHDALFGGPAGGINFALGGGALVAYMNGYLTVDGSLFVNNVAQNGDGGAILNGRSEGQNLFFTGADAFDVSTTVTNSVFAGNQAPAGNGGAVASLPGLDFTIPARTVASTRVAVATSAFKSNSTGGNGGALYLDASTGTIGSNAYLKNSASLGNSIYAVDSIVNGDPTSPLIR